MRRSRVLCTSMAWLTFVWSVGCVDTAVEPKKDAPDPEVALLEAMAKQSQTWVERMDPFVTTNPNGIYTFDSTEFQNYYQPQGDDAKVVYELQNGIAIANATILKEGKGGDVCEGSTCSYHWWGTKCCYDGAAAQWIVYAVSIGLYIAGLGFLSVVLLGWIQTTLTIHGHFCITRFINGVVYVSAN